MALRAAMLCKADLATKMVVEMTSCKARWGAITPCNPAKPPEVAQAIFEHYLPRFAGDQTAASTARAWWLGWPTGWIAWRVCSPPIWRPRGTKIPLPSAARPSGLVQNLIAWELDLDLSSALQAAAFSPAGRCQSAEPASRAGVHRRAPAQRVAGARSPLRCRRCRPGSPGRLTRRALPGQSSALEAWTGRPDWNTILPAYARCVRITRDLKEHFPVVEADFVEPAERELSAALLKAEAMQPPAGSVDGFLEAFLPMIPAVNLFFDKVLVMADDLRLRDNRLGLLQRIAALASGVADLSRLEGF